MKETTQSPSFDHIRDSLIDRAGPLIAFAYLMGSAATERFHSGSDVDLAIYWKTVPDHDDLSGILTDLEARYNCDVDIATLNEIDVTLSRL